MWTWGISAACCAQRRRRALHGVQITLWVVAKKLQVRRMPDVLTRTFYLSASTNQPMSANGIDKEHTEIIALSLALSIVCSAKKENMWMRKGFSKTMIARLACAKQC